jgi:hypothetical protein
MLMYFYTRHILEDRILIHLFTAIWASNCTILEAEMRS